MTPVKLKERKARSKKLLHALKELFPEMKTTLDYSNMWELVVAVSLSAQTTDRQVNKVTKKLFKKYKTLDDYINADPQEFETDINSLGFYRNKARNALAAARILQDKFGGIVPQTIAELIQLPGVGRKTANVVLCNGFNIAEGIAVDTHVRRFAIRYDLTDHADPNKIEQDLLQIISKKEWLHIAYYFIQYGRTIAPARRYDVSQDPLVKIYPPAGEVFRV